MKKLIVCLIVLAFATAGASANMVVDGSFEGLTASTGWVAIAADGETFGAWTGYTTEGWVYLYEGVEMLPAEGTAQCNLGYNYLAAHITQTITGFTVGDAYEVSFAACSYNGDPFVTNVQVYNVIADACDLYETFDVTGEGGVDEMVYHSFEFDASNTELELHLICPDGYAMNYDDVSVIRACIPVGTAEPVDPCGLEVYENSGQGSTAGEFTVVLDSSPGGSDTITVDIDPNSNGNGVDVSVDPCSLTFTTANWDTPQTVTVTAINDTWADGKTEVDQVGFTVTSAESDPCYADGCISSVSVTIHDDDSDAILVSKTSASIAEGGAGDSYTIELATDPTDPVTIIVAADYTETSPTDPNMIVVPFDCQLTVNGGGSDTLVFTAKEAPQTVTIAAVDDSMVEVDPHTVIISNIVSTNDAIYSALSAADVDVSITDNDARAWSFGDDVLLSMPPNYSFETPALSEGQSYVNSDPNIGPFGTGGDGVTYPAVTWPMPISHISDPCWALMYEVGQTVPDGDNVLVMPGNASVSDQYLGYSSGLCEHLIEPGPVSYTLTAAVGLPKEAGGSANPDAYASLNFWVAPPAGWVEIADSGNLIAELTPGEWVDKTVCVEIPEDSPYSGSPLYFGVHGEHVHFDNLRLTVSNHPCPGCYIDPTEAEGDLDDDCDVDLADFAIMAEGYLGCYIYPGCITGW